MRRTPDGRWPAGGRPRSKRPAVAVPAAHRREGAATPSRPERGGRATRGGAGGSAPLHFRRAVTFDWSRPVLVGVVNVTPGLVLRRRAVRPAPAAAVAAASAGRGRRRRHRRRRRIDPPAARGPVSAAAEDSPAWSRSRAPGRPDGVRRCRSTPRKAEVAPGGACAGAELVNDISGGLFDPALIEVTAAAGAAWCCGHVRGRVLAEVHAAERDAAPASTRWRRAGRPAWRRLPAACAPAPSSTPGSASASARPQTWSSSRRAGELGARLGCPVDGRPLAQALPRRAHRAPGRPHATTPPSAPRWPRSPAAPQLVRVHDVGAAAARPSRCSPRPSGRRAP